jgi:hypothetical protein
MEVFTLPPLSERSPLPRFVAPLAFFTLVFTLCLPPRFNLRAFFFFFTIAIPTLALLPYYTTGITLSDYRTSTFLVYWVVRALDFFVLAAPEKEFWRVRTGGGAKVATEQHWDKHLWSWRKLGWSVGIWATQRGIGWSWEVKNVGPKAPIGYLVW